MQTKDSQIHERKVDICSSGDDIAANFSLKIPSGNGNNDGNIVEVKFLGTPCIASRMDY